MKIFTMVNSLINRLFDTAMDYKRAGDSELFNKYFNQVLDVIYLITIEF